MKNNKLINVNIQKKRGKLFVSSRDIAKGLEKEHKHVLNKIREVLNESEFCPVTYIDEKGESRPEYMLDKDAFILLVMNYTGYNDFKRAYIKRFNEMESLLREQQSTEYKQLRLYDIPHQKEQMKKLDTSIKDKTPIKYIKANTIADKAIAKKYGYNKSLKKQNMTKEMIEEREKILEQITALMIAQSLGINIPHISDIIYNNI